MDSFKYQNNELYCEDVKIKDLAEKYGTPLYVYSKNTIIDKFKATDEAFSSVDHTICYAMKANSNMEFLKLIASIGGGGDVVSGGELYLALKAGIPANKIVYASVGKTDDEMKFAIESGILAFNVESEPELDVLNEVAQKMGKKAPLAIRINPDIDVHGHPYISTGKSINKFGIDINTAYEVFLRAKEMDGIEIVGVHSHIGSQILNLDYFNASAKKLFDFVTKLREAGIEIQHVDIGGGLGVHYPDVIEEYAEERKEVPAPAELAARVIEVLKPLNCEIIFEPGRSIVGEAGALITQTNYIKYSRDTKFIVVDGGMNDLIRPSLYEAYHQIVPLTYTDGKLEKADVVGPICETGDFLAKGRNLPQVKRGDYLAVMTAGAYGYSLASNYNTRPRPAEIWVDGDKVEVIREREKVEDWI
ncbi:diaminopimelate decarboxylase [candidate division KSB1 bacterium 4572_119]|nr:MAG: diaminopimelate decarboxylase [candidate division KSB1 bacterium 4572_119]